MAHNYQQGGHIGGGGRSVTESDMQYRKDKDADYIKQINELQQRLNEVVNLKDDLFIQNKQLTKQNHKLLDIIYNLTEK